MSLAGTEVAPDPDPELRVAPDIAPGAAPGVDPDDDRCRRLARLAAALDPSPSTQARWLREAERTLARHLRESAERPVVPPRGGGYPQAREMPRTGRDVRDVCADLADVLRDGVATTSGRYLGYIPAGGLPAAAVADYLAAGMNPYAALSTVSPGAAAIENGVVDWLCSAIGLPAGSGGVLTSGGTTAALTAVVAARDGHRVLAGDVSRSVVYATDQAHLSLRRALHVAGCGAVTVRCVKTDDRYRMNADALAEAVRADRAAGLRPWLVAATAGTTNSGAVDPLARIADVAHRAGLWFHVDGAYGGLFTLSPQGRPVLAGLERADSVIVDPHKTLFLPYGTGAVLVADRHRLAGSFGTAAEYLPAGDDLEPADLGPELTRPFRALRLWMALHLAGEQAFSAALSEKLLLARLAYRRLEAVPGLTLGPAPQLSLFVFRVDDALGGDRATASLVHTLGRDGTAFLSTTSLDGRLWARVAVLSFRTHLVHLTDLCDAIAAVVGRWRRPGGGEPGCGEPGGGEQGGGEPEGGEPGGGEPGGGERDGKGSATSRERPVTGQEDSLEPLQMVFTPLHSTPQPVLGCELDVLHHWYGDTPELLEQAYGRFADDTAFVSLWWHGEVVAFARLIRPGRHLLKTLDDVASPPWGIDGVAAVTALGVDLDRTWDLATLGVRRFDRLAPAVTSAALYRAIVLALEANDVAWSVAIVDATARRLVTMRGHHLVDIPGTGPREYMGSPACAPVLVDLRAAGASTAGLPPDGLVVPPVADLRFGAVRAS